ncbi:MAG: AraC family transcriptional regulator [bacterium]|nr:AraC family transcriptional regulator [bacterium]
MPTESLFQENIPNTSRIIYTPSDFAKLSLLHLQEIGSRQATEPHTNERENLASYLFFMVRSGSGTLIYDGVKYPLTSGDCVFIDCKLPYSHSTAADDLWNLSWVHFNGPTAANIYQKYIQRGGLPAFRPQNFNGYLSIFYELYEIASKTSSTRDMELNTGISRLLALLMADSKHSEEAAPGTKKMNLTEIKHYLDENYNKKIALDDLAERYFINKYYLTRIFKEQFGMSINNYLLSVRITHAKNDLRFTDKSAEQIGIDCGIGEIYYFSRVFKKVEGMSVREYRRLWR